MEERSQHVGLAGGATPGARTVALLILCLGTLMVVLDGSIVFVALPTIGVSLGLGTKSLIWVVNGYVIPYGGCLLLCGRLGDHYGHRRLFLLGIVFFTVASLACGVAETPALLVGGRAVQGAAGAIVATVSVSSIMEDFEDPTQRAQVMAVYNCVLAFGGSAGLLIGGLVTHALNWRWLFLINIPVGILICVLFFPSCFHNGRAKTRVPLDISGAVTITTCLLLTTFSVLRAADAGWLSVYTWGPLGAALGCFVLFLAIEARVPIPIIPPALIGERNLRVSIGTGALQAGANSIWAFTSPLYLQCTLGYDTLTLALSFLPVPLVYGLFSLGLSAKLVGRFGSKALFTAGATVLAVGYLLLARVPVGAVYGLDVLPAMLLIGLGVGLSYSPYVLIALRRVSKEDYGLASAILSSSTLLGGAVALAVVVGRAVVRCDHYASGAATQQFLQPDRYAMALCTAALLVGGAALLSRYIDE